MRFSPDGKTLVSANVDGTVTVLDAASATPRDTLHGHADAVQQPVFSPDGTTLYTVSADGTAIAWDLTGTRSMRRSFTFTGDREGERDVPGRFSPDGRLIAVGLAEKGVALWDATDLTQVGAPLMETGGEVIGARLLARRVHACGRDPHRRGDGLGRRHPLAAVRARPRRQFRPARGGRLQRRRDDARHDGSTPA